MKRKFSISDILSKISRENLKKRFEPFLNIKDVVGIDISTRADSINDEILNYLEGGSPKSGPKIKNGMVFCVEPMICQKDGTPVIGHDKWKVTSKDGLRTSHYEHCMAVVNGRAEILSLA